jgi:NADH-quinone oxidoreductase subunit E
MMVNWEFFDQQTPASARDLVDRLRAGEDVAPTRGAAKVCSFKEVSRVLAGFSDGRADEGVAAGGPTLVGTRLARERGWTAPPSGAGGHADAAAGAGEAAGRRDEPSRRTPDSDSDAPAAAGERGGTTAGKPSAEATQSGEDA